MKIQTRITNNPDFSGLKFYIEAGRDFDQSLYEEVYSVKLTASNVAKIITELSHLKSGEWLQVSH
jgi:hypothetical protein